MERTINILEIVKVLETVKATIVAQGSEIKNLKSELKAKRFRGFENCFQRKNICFSQGSTELPKQGFQDHDQKQIFD